MPLFPVSRAIATLEGSTPWTWRGGINCLALTLLGELLNIGRHLLHALDARDVDVANAAAVGAARVAWELAEHDEVKSVLGIVSGARIGKQTVGIDLNGARVLLILQTYGWAGDWAGGGGGE